MLAIGCLCMCWAGCSKQGDSVSDQPPPPPPVEKIFSISGLTFTPQEIPVKRSAATFSIHGQFNYVNARSGLTALRLKSALGFDTTLALQGASAPESGMVQGYFELLRPGTPLDLGFEVWLIDGSGQASNKLGGTIFIRVDDSGEKWNSTTISILRVFNDIIWANNRFASVTNAGTVGLSPDGINWQEISLQTGLMPGPMRGITWTGSQYVAVGDHGSIFTSANGTEWTDHSFPENENFTTLRSVSSNGSVIVAVGENAVPVGCTDIVVSADGIQFHRVDSFIARSELRAVTWTGSRFVAVGIGRTPENAFPLIMYSTDGFHWFSQSNMSLTGKYLLDVIQAGPNTIAIGGGVVAISNQNGPWTFHSIPASVAVSALAWSGNKLVGVGNGIFTSGDGINWNQTYPSNSLMLHFSCIAWDGGQYVAAGMDERTVMISP